MPLRWYTVVVNCLDVAAQADWWSRVLGWPKVYEAPDEVVLVAPHAAVEDDPVPVMQRGPGLVFVPVPEAKSASVPNRLHLDLAPLVDEDQAGAVERLLAMGASRVDVGQGGVSWVVLADPEGNEFCVLSPRD